MEKKVNITYACPIPWESMTAINDKERFCKKCTKKVRDFSNNRITDTQTLTCGSFRTSQVNSVVRTFEANKSGILTLSLITFLGLTPIAGFSQVNSTNTISTSKSDTFKNDIISFTGTVKEKGSNYPLAHANIILKNKPGEIITGSTTDIDGRFLIRMDSTINLNEVIVEISSVGYESRIFPIEEASFNETTLQFDLNLFELDETIMGEFIIITEPSKDPTLYHSKTFESEDIKGAYRK